jgi:hypothetical protein
MVASQEWSRAPSYHGILPSRYISESAPASLANAARASAYLPYERAHRTVELINLSLLPDDDRVSDAWDREAADRFDAYDRGEMRAVSWEEIKRRSTFK